MLLFGVILPLPSREFSADMSLGAHCDYLDKKEQDGSAAGEGPSMVFKWPGSFSFLLLGS